MFLIFCVLSFDKKKRFEANWHLHNFNFSRKSESGVCVARLTNDNIEIVEWMDTVKIFLSEEERAKHGI